MKYILLIFCLGIWTPAAFGASAKEGEGLFNNRACVSCHSIGSFGTATTGPNLAGVTKRRKEEWLVRWIFGPDNMANDPTYLELKKTYPSDMPNLGLTAEEVQSLFLYLKLQDSH